MEEYLEFLNRSFLDSSPVSILIYLVSALVLFAPFLFSPKNSIHPLILIVFWILASVLLGTFSFTYSITVNYFLRPPYSHYVFLGLGAFAIAAVLFFGIRHWHRQSRKSRYFAWWVTTWQMAEDGNWRQQPTLIINGNKYVFDTPQGYIQLFEEMLVENPSDTKIGSYLEAMKNSQLYRMTCRARLNLSSDPPFVPSSHFVPTNFKSSSATPATIISPAEEFRPSAREPAPYIQPGPARHEAPAPAPSYSDLPPSQPMALRLKRSQKQGTMGGIIYTLDARIDVSAEVGALIAQHNLGGRLIYESAARQTHAAKAQAHLAGSRDNTSFFAPPSAQAMGIAKTFWKLGRAAVSATRASFALRVTVAGLMSGVHVECKSMEELLEAEDAFREAKLNLESTIDAAQSFDGREEVI